MPSQPEKYGMKIWWACDSETHYPLNGIPYTGMEGNSITRGFGAQVVQNRVKPFYRTNINVIFDHYFSDFVLATILLANGLTCVGTVKKNKIFVPNEFYHIKLAKKDRRFFDLQPKQPWYRMFRRKDKCVSIIHHAPRK